MNLQLLLSGVQHQDASSPARPALTGPLESSQALFRQALSQAASASAQPPATNLAHAGIGEEPAAALLDILHSLGFELSEAELSTLLSQLSLASEETLPSLLARDTSAGEASTPLEEIAERLKLMASFSDVSASQASPIAVPTLESIARQLDLGEDETASLISTLQALIDPRQPLGAGVAGTFELSEDEVAQVSSTLSTLLAPLKGDSKQASPLPLAEPARQASFALTSMAQWRSDAAALDAYRPNASYSPAASLLNPSFTSLASQDIMAALAPADGTTLDDLMPLRAGQMAGGLQPFVPSSPLAEGATGTALPSFIGTPVTSPAWPSQLGQQLIQFSQRGGDQQVQMQLHPAELGPLSITLKMTDQGTQAHFLSAHAQVRQVIEHAIPQLRETLAEQGISLGETSVGEQQHHREQSPSRSGKGAIADASSGDSLLPDGSHDGTAMPDSTTLTLDGRVDLYA
ncbi:flagellar hook-length control protein FliK [Halomonas aquamarina]|uniref:Flagellar hook-length control protein FliK n=1 Tax=Vreelandella aquamarina TaxID=77097 RepID=A0ACC5VXF5_9GAMM|nr:flagellar hook-length control protein FliK [Halomonas aquamarina]MBZ5488550.1 flagellar hook-length control protein FliK [Halomonas aquamarina]